MSKNWPDRNVGPYFFCCDIYDELMLITGTSVFSYNCYIDYQIRNADMLYFC